MEKADVADFIGEFRERINITQDIICLLLEEAFKGKKEGRREQSL